MVKYILSSLLLFFAGSAYGQGWERVFGGSGQDVANDLAITLDGGYLMAGYANNGVKIYLVKTDIDGQLQWTKQINADPAAPGVQGVGNAVVVTRDSGYVVAGYRSKTSAMNSGRFALLIKTDNAGNVLWRKFYGGVNTNDEAYDVVELPDGGFLLTGYRGYQDGTEDVFVLRTDAQGNELWLKTFGLPGGSEKGFDLALLPGGDIAVCGEAKPTITSDKDIYVLRLNGAGALLWAQSYGFQNDQGSNSDETARGLVRTKDNQLLLTGYTTSQPGGAGFLIKVDAGGSPSPLWSKAIPNTDFYDLGERADGDIFVTGYKNLSLAQVDVYIARTTAAGDLVWETTVGKGGPDAGFGIVPTPDGGAAIAGTSQVFFGVGNLEELPYLVKIDGNGLIFTSYLQMNIFQDADFSCSFTQGEKGLEDWIVKVESPNFLRYAIADEEGKIQLAVDTGSYNITLVRPNDYWTPCQAVTAITVPNFYDTIPVFIPVRPSSSCPRNEVDVATSILRRCTENVYTVRYCNSGTIPSENTRIEVTLDPFLSYVSSSIPVNGQTGNVLTFNVGTLNNGDCGAFTVTALLDCGATPGQAHCVNAHIYPDSFCNVTNWNGAFVVARGQCDGDTVRMFLKNTGFNPTTTIEYVIAEDVIMLTAPGANSLNLGGEEEVEVFNKEATGKTYRLIATQTQGYPGTSYPTAAVEGCKSDTSNTFSTGFYTMFPEDDQDAFVETDCQENTETDYDPTFLKRGHPKGYDVAHYISPQTDLDYLIHFQNTGTDTVQQVIIRDTLSDLLDPTTVLPGAASHPYDFQVYGNGIVQFTIPNANLLPGSSANSGFVKFRVAQKPQPDTVCGLQIFNSAAIYFNFYAPVQSNQTLHTVCSPDTFLVVNTIYIPYPGANVRVFPNPFESSAQFEITGVNAHSYYLEIYDSQGRLLFDKFYNTPTFRLSPLHLPPGVLFYRLAADGRPVAAGRMIRK